MAALASDLNLLFAVLALQNELVAKDDLLAAMNVWGLEKDRPLGDILVERKALSPDDRQLLDSLIARQLQRHGSAEKSLAAVPVAPALKEQIRSLCHAHLHATLAHSGDGAPDPSATASHVPIENGLRYRILRHHAMGGLGEVFVAQDAELHREVALKEIKTQHAGNRESRERFLLEAEITGGLEHPGIVPVYGLGTYTDGRPFYAMRFIRGDNLKEAIGRFHRKDEGGRMKDEKGVSDSSFRLHPSSFQSLEFRQLLGCFVDVCNAIAYAHSRGVLHRDLKPGNIMLGKYGETLVVDWGLAKAVGSQKPCEPGASGSPLPQGEGLGVRGETPLIPASGSDYAHTMAGTAIGTPAYMSPEQAAGRLDLVGPGSDIYSLGATLYTLLTNRAPVEGADVPEVLRKVQAGDIDWPTTRTIPPALVAVCKKAMALTSADRYATPLALAEDIEHWLADEPVSAYREPWTRRLARWRRRHNTLVTAAALVLVTLIAASVLGLGVIERQTAQTRVLAQVDALKDAAPGTVPSLLADLAQPSVAAFASMQARELWNDPALTDRQRLRVGLALVGDARILANAATDADVRRRLLELAQKADDPNEVLLVRDALAPHADTLKADLWKRSQDPALPRVERLRLWAILATLDAEGPGWADAAEPAVLELCTANPLHLGVWQQALTPVRQKLLPALQKAYVEPVAERRQLAAALLADYAADQPAVLHDLLLDADAKQYAAIFPKLQTHTDKAVPLLLAELNKKPTPPKAGEEILKKEGAIAADDPMMKTSDGQTLPAKMFEVAIQGGAAYKIRMTSKDIDSFVVLHDPAGKEVGFDDDSGGDLDSLLEFTAPKTEANSFSREPPASVESALAGGSRLNKYKVYAASLPNKDRQAAGAFVLTITEYASSGPMENLAARQANAAVALLRLGHAAKVWPLLKHSPDPSVRSYLVHKLGPQGAEWDVLVKRLDNEADTSTKRALLLSLGGFSEPDAPAREAAPATDAPSLARRAQLLPKLLDLYKTDPDPGLHAAAAWLLTHWGHRDKLLAIDRELASANGHIQNKGGGKAPHSKGPTWWINSQGQTMVALPGPIEFQMGASASDPDRLADEVQHLRRINRSFALAAHPVTVEQFSKFRKNHNYLKKYAPTPDCPVHGAAWYEAAAYCNWLSEQEKIPKDQWCYETNAAGQVVKLKEKHLSLTGYRLPTEAEMEYACRAEALTSRYYGAQEDLLGRYAWYIKNADDRSWPVGLTKPNDFGFFDMHGNVWNWCQERERPYAKTVAQNAVEDVEDVEDVLTISATDSRVLRGGAFSDRPRNVRSSFRYRYLPLARNFSFGFRPSRTLPLEFFTALPLYAGQVTQK